MNGITRDNHDECGRNHDRGKEIEEGSGEVH
jgi:hypothetical protein